MSELDTQLVYAVDRNNEAAWAAMMKICQERLRPGQVIPLSADEFAALKSGVLVLQMPSQGKGAGDV